MFNMLSNQSTLLEIIQKCSQQKVEIVLANLEELIQLLKQPASNLLNNRRQYGVILPNDNATIELNQFSNQELLANKHALVQAINQFCLTEATVIRHNFENCHTILAMPKDMTFGQKQCPPQLHKISNVSPIRLVEIRQRLAQAIQRPKQHIQIKEKLNGLVQRQTENKLFKKVAK